MQVLVPLGWFVAVHAIEKQRQTGIVTQRLFDLGGTTQRLAQRPLRRDAGMYQGHLALGVVVHQLLHAQPIEQIVAVRRIENLAQGIALLQTLDVVGHGQQMQIMVAQHTGHGVANGVEKTQGLQRLRAAVDQVADQPKLVLRGIEGHLLEQALERFEATLQVADGIHRHQ